jgi:hypothetical protein
VPPGRVPEPPECPADEAEPAGAALANAPSHSPRDRLPDLRPRIPLAPSTSVTGDAPQRARREKDTRGFESGDKFCDHECVNAILEWDRADIGRNKRRKAEHIALGAGERRNAAGYGAFLSELLLRQR